MCVCVIYIYIYSYPFCLYLDSICSKSTAAMEPTGWGGAADWPPPSWSPSVTGPGRKS